MPALCSGIGAGMTRGKAPMLAGDDIS